MDTPRSASPFNAPATELDDHRFQAHSLPRSNTATSAAPFRRYSQASVGRSSPSEIQDARAPTIEVEECAIIIDDDNEAKAPVSPFFAPERRASVVQGRPRAESSLTTNGRSYRFPSRASSRSPSPTGSVNAFASPEHRRRVDRSATVSSQAPPDLVLGLRRTISRRQTFSDGDGNSGANSGDEASQKAEEDVCFPPPEETRIRGGIDFDEMEAFVASQFCEKGAGRQRACERRRKMSSTSSLKGPRYNHRETSPSPTGTEKTIANDFAKVPGVAIDDTASVSDEKQRLPSPLEARQRKVTSPDRFSFFSSEMDATIHAPEIGDLLIEGETFYDLFRGGQGVWWLDCLNPTHEELSMLMRAFAIHPLTAEDIRVQETREKVELFRSYYFVCFRSFVQQKKAEDFMEPINFYIIVFREGILSFHFAPCPHSANVRRRIRQLRDYVALSSDWICYALIDDIVDSFGPVIQDIEKETDAIEDAVFVARDHDYTEMLKQIGECRKKCMGLMRLLGGKADVIKGFAKRCNEQYQVTPRGEIGLYLGDIQDHVVTMMSNLSHFEKMLSRSHANYLAQLSVESIQTNNRANEVLGRITTIATILVPLNLICGLFGMNVHVPGQDDPNLYWFFGILGSIFLFTLVSCIFAKRNQLI